MFCDEGEYKVQHRRLEIISHLRETSEQSFRKASSVFAFNLECIYSRNQVWKVHLKINDNLDFLVQFVLFWYSQYAF